MKNLNIVSDVVLVRMWRLAFNACCASYERSLRCKAKSRASNHVLRCWERYQNITIEFEKRGL
jgi:hypothetical protein